MTGRKTSWLGFGVALAVYVARVLPWARAQLWIDEVITLYNYAGAFHPGTTLGSVFRSYTLANNHILSTAIYWAWLKVVPLTAPEVLLRLPSLLWGALTLAVVAFWWRKWLGTTVAALGAMIFAASPVFPAFAYQIRGYSLSMLLAAIGVAFALETLAAKQPYHRLLFQIGLFALGVAQPLIMPSAALFPGVLALFLFCCFDRYCKSFSCNILHRIFIAYPSALGGLMGLSYYFTLGEQFQLARLDAGEISADWWTSGSSARHVVVALAAHLGVLLLALCWQMFPRAWRKGASRKILVILLTWIFGEALMYVAAGHQTVPFPRNSLVFFPFVTFAGLLAVRLLPRKLDRRRFTLCLSLGALALGLSITYWQEAVCLRLVRAGDIPQDLLKQQYRGDDSTRTFVRNLHAAGLCESSFLLVSDNDGTVAKWYYNLLGHPAWRTLDRTEAQGWRGFWKTPEGPAPLFVSSRLDAEAEQLYRLAEYPFPHKCHQRLKLRDLWGP